MTIRILGAIMIVIGCTTYGFMLSASYRREIRTVSQLLDFLRGMECELLYKNAQLPVIIDSLTNNKKGIICDFFRQLSNELDSQIQPNVYYCVDAALSKIPNIPAETCNLIRKFGQSLGKYSDDGQLLELQAVQQEAQHQLSRLEADVASKTKTYKTLGICAGAAIVVIFM